MLELKALDRLTCAHATRSIVKFVIELLNRIIVKVGAQFRTNTKTYTRVLAACSKALAEVLLDHGEEIEEEESAPRPKEVGLAPRRRPSPTLEPHASLVPYILP